MSFKEKEVDAYSEKSVQSLQRHVRMLLADVADDDASKYLNVRVRKEFGIAAYAPAVKAAFRIVRHHGDFVVLNARGTLLDLFVFKTLFLLSQAPIEPIRECPECGKIFYRHDQRQKYCERRCATLGDPLQMNNIGQREFKAIIEAAGVRTIKFHGMRHTCATLALKAGVPVRVVADRLGHKGVEITMNIYQHVLPDMQEDAAEKLGSLLFG